MVVYPLPCFNTVADATSPLSFNVKPIRAPEPLPIIFTSGTVLYPAPLSNIVTAVMLESTTVNDNLACLKFATPIKFKSSTLSTTWSINLEFNVGAVSNCNNGDISLVSTIKFCANTLLTLSTYCFIASILFLNHPCIGRILVPYLIFSFRFMSGT